MTTTKASLSMELGPESTQLVFTMRRMEAVIAKLREILTRSYSQNLISQNEFNSLYEELLELNRLVSTQTQDAKATSEKDPQYTIDMEDDSIFNVTDEELERFKPRSPINQGTWAQIQRDLLKPD